MDAFEVTGTPIPVDGGYGCAGYHFTVAIYASNLQGTVHIEASVMNSPTDQDWFQAVPAITFPRAGTVLQAGSGETAAVLLNFPGNFAWIRARLSRDKLVKPTDGTNLYGFVDRILMN